MLILFWPKTAFADHLISELQKCFQLRRFVANALPITKKKFSKLTISPYPVQIIVALIGVLFSPSRKEMPSSVILISLNSFSLKIEMRNRISLVNGSKTGATVKDKEI